MGRLTMTEPVDMGGWLTALCEIPFIPIIDTDIHVAKAWASAGDREGALDFAMERFGIDRTRFDDSTEELIALGFLEDVVSISCTEPHDHGGECEEHLLEFRIPGAGA
jgi:hypothetical protein